MPIIVNSPFSGKPVKIRDQDVGRAVRDEEKRIFYVVARPDGKGYYSSPTRKGSAKDEQRYFQMQEQMSQAKQVGVQRSTQQIHDAMGKGRKGSRLRLLVMLLILLLVAGGLYFFLVLEGDTSRIPRWPIQPDTAPSRDGEAALPGSIDEQGNTTWHADGLADQQSSATFLTTASGLRYRIDRPGTGAIATAGSYVVIDYQVSLLDGPLVDTTAQSGPIGFVLWAGQVIRGWDEGIAGMRSGEKRTLIVPRKLVHAVTPSRYMAQLPDATLHCEIQLRQVRPGLEYTIDVEGHGAMARPGDVVLVHYVGYVVGQTEPFDSSYDRGRPIRFRIGAGQVITGWELGISGMAEGEKRTLNIPYYLAYGQRGFGEVIRPESDLTYQIELIAVEEATPDAIRQPNR